ncbi:IPT/TIG domain-containing protein [Arenibacter troitsensis]|uniref:IPT/TIG domain-containing protein n=1 Tax=Arenibacter troitsensis TaxID=188872 RepID=A0A1X7I292_9FLAO|nr:IPT/TIG domain-containing protein [Arenibacter troitsensis]MDX1699117.1 IPT/TIG domain-containing protein [Melioribacteraceae bacterium]SMG08104.1 IPT/TIG domain-containing protein [Arenibacter troitsensis]
MKFLLIVFNIFIIISCSKSPEIVNTEPEIINTEPEEVLEPENPVYQKDSTLIIDSVFPQLVDLGDTLNLKGKNFNRDIRLTLGQVQLKNLFNNDSIIQFEIPYWGFDPDSLIIDIDNRDTIVAFNNAFQLYEPVIDSIPSNYGLRDTVVVYGKHLTNYPEAVNGIIELNNDRISVLDHSKDSIRFILPYNVNKHENDLVIRAQLREIVRPKSIVIPDPVISGVSNDSLLIGESLTIYGSNFFEYRDYLHEVYIGENRAEIEEVYSDSIIAKVPLGLYRDRNINNVTVKVVEKEVTKDFGLYLKNTWYQYGRIDNLGLSGIGDRGHTSNWSFYYNNAFYSLQDRDGGLCYGDFKKLGFSKYNLDENSWETLPDIQIACDSGRFSGFHTYSLNDGNVYIYLSRETDNFYEYDLESGALTPLQDFQNVDVVKEPMGFVLNNTFYFGMGRTGGTSTNPNRKLWKFEESTNSWGYVSEMPFVEGQGTGDHSSYFIKDGKAYIGNGWQLYDMWEFTPEETWIRKTDLVNPVGGTAFVKVENSGYYHERHGLGHTGGTFHQYDINLDTYSMREDLTITGYLLESKSMFVHNGFVYFIGYTGSPFLPDFSSIKRYDHVVLRTEISNFID